MSRARRGRAAATVPPAPALRHAERMSHLRRARAAPLALVALLAAGCGSGHGTRSTAASSPAPAATSSTAAKPAPRAAATVLRDWPLFGLRSSRENATDAATGVTAADLGRLRRHQVRLPGTVDSSPIVLGDTAYATTTYGRTVAVDLATGRLRWTFTPSGYDALVGSYRITNASPAADPSRSFVFTASPDGLVHKLRVGDGREVGGGWPVSITRDPTREKITSSFNVSGPLLVVTTGGYIGDAPPYQGHVVTIERATGRIVAVFNSLCSDRRAIIVPSSCAASDSAIWARSGAVVVPGSRDLLVATGNAPFDGRTDWGDSVLRLSSDAGRLRQSWTPRDQAQLNATDGDLGSTAPALLGHGLALQGGKAAVLDLLDLSRLNGTPRAGPRLGGEVQELPAPGGQGVFSAPAVWHHGGRTTVFVTTGGGTAAYRLVGRRLRRTWFNDHGGTSPVVAGGLLYVYDPGGGLRVYAPGTGRPLKVLAAGAGHWNSPVIAGGRIVLPEGNANDHAGDGVLDIWSVAR
jgi:outer membrane protein assembly factor BamB